MTLGPSPLLTSAVVAWPPPPGVPAETLAELHAWLTDHGGPAHPAQLATLAISQRELMVWHVNPAGGADLGPYVAELRSHPSVRMLAVLAEAGALSCAAVVVREDLTERWRCNMLVDDQGRHRGNHVDGRFGDEAEWPNGNPADDRPRPPAPPAGVHRAADDPRAEPIRAAIAAAAAGCAELGYAGGPEHLDPGGPIYGTTRACPRCAAAAVVALLDDTEVHP